MSNPDPTPAPAVTARPEDVAGHILAVAPRVADGPTNAAPASAPETPAPPGPQFVDKGGRVFDVAKHKAKADGTPYIKADGYFMPIGGRKPKSANPPAPETPPSAPIPDAGNAWEKSARDFATAKPVAEAGPNGAEKTQGAAPQVAKPPEAECSPEAGAEVAARALYQVVGALTGEHAEARATGAEHVNLRNVLAAYCRQRGWVATGFWAVVISLVAYGLGVAEKPKTSERLGGWLAKMRAKKTPAAPKAEAVAAEAPKPDASPAPVPSFNLSTENIRLT